MIKGELRDWKSYNGGSIQNSIDLYAEAIKDSFEEDIAKKNFYINYDESTKYSCLIRDFNALNYDNAKKKIVMYPYEGVVQGDFINFVDNDDATETNSWLCIATDNIFEWQQEAVIVLCSKYNLRWLDEEKELHDVQCVITDVGRISIGTNGNSDFSAINKSLVLLTQNNEETETIPLNMRIKVGNQYFLVSKITDFIGNFDSNLLIFSYVATEEVPEDATYLTSDVAYNNWYTDPVYTTIPDDVDNGIVISTVSNAVVNNNTRVITIYKGHLGTFGLSVVVNGEEEDDSFTITLLTGSITLSVLTINSFTLISETTENGSIKFVDSEGTEITYTIKTVTLFGG